MSPVILRGLNGTNPLGFMAALGLLRLVRRESDAVRLGFLSDGSFYPFIDGVDVDLPALVTADAAAAKGKQSWSLEYAKEEKTGVKLVADLKAPPDVFTGFLERCVEDWSRGGGEAAAYAAAFGTNVAVDGKGNTKPTALHFTAANQQFLGTVEELRAAVTSEWAARSLFEGHAVRSGSNLRWDPAADRNWALMANNPNDDGTSVDAPVEWLAFRGLPLFPSFPRGSRIVTTAISGRGDVGRRAATKSTSLRIVTTAISDRGDGMKMTWPLWSVPVSIETIRSALQMEWNGAPRDRAMRGVFAVCTSAIRRTSQGFGNFSPASVICDQVS